MPQPPNSISIQTRRTTLRSTRTSKDPENVTARPTRASALRAKSIADKDKASSAVTTRSTTAGASKAAKATGEGEGNVGKRKREALAEVATGGNLKPKASGGVSGVKGKEKEGVKATVSATTTTTRVLRRAGSVAPPARTAKAKATEAPATKKPPTRRAASKPPSTTQVFVDPTPVGSVKRKDTDDGEARRAFKRRHMDAIPEDAPPAPAPAPKEVEESKDESQLEADKIASELAAVESSFEPEPAVQDWDDLDADDWDDPLMVSEYVVDVCKYWKEIEVATLPNAEYMDAQSEITWDQRGILVDWLIQVHMRFNLLPESLYLTINLMDRFLSSRPISLNKLQLVGLACFFIATKYEETCAPSVTEIVFLSDNQYTVAEVLKAEMYILRILNWDLRNPGVMNWLRRGSKADECEGTARTVAKYLAEISCLEKKLIAVVPSLIAAAALWLGRLIVGREDWVRVALSSRHVHRELTASHRPPPLNISPRSAKRRYIPSRLSCWSTFS